MRMRDLPNAPAFVGRDPFLPVLQAASKRCILQASGKQDKRIASNNNNSNNNTTSKAYRRIVGFDGSKPGLVLAKQLGRA